MVSLAALLSHAEDLSWKSFRTILYAAEFL